MTRGENRTVTSKLRVDTSHWDHVHLHRHAGVNFKMSQRVTEAPERARKCPTFSGLWGPLLWRPLFPETRR